MTGTTKQIAYATDIINKTIARIDEVIADGTQKIERREASARAMYPEYVCPDRKILAAWEECKAYMRMVEEKTENAADIIAYEKAEGWFDYVEICVCQMCGHSRINA